MQRIFSRRALIDTVLKALPFLVAVELGINTASAATLSPLDPSDPTAKALGYVSDSAKPDQKCASCTQFQGQAGDARGGCNIYPGKSVAKGAWCSLWTKKT